MIVLDQSLVKTTLHFSPGGEAIRWIGQIEPHAKGADMTCRSSARHQPCDKTILSQLLWAEMHFADEAALKMGMKSPEMAEAGANLAIFAEGLVTLMFAEDEPLES